MDPTPFGDALARKVAAKLRREGGDSTLRSMHRDYCGHGLVFERGGRPGMPGGTPAGGPDATGGGDRDAIGAYVLYEVHDGYFAQRVGSWASEGEFVAFLAAQSDLSCGGADPGEPLLFTAEPFLLNNQRLSRAQLEAYVAA